jgi:hypothetical protein
VWFEVTAESSKIVDQFRRLSTEITDRELRSASPAERAEWHRFVEQWPTEDDLRRGVIKQSADDLSWMLARARRFRALIGAPRPAPDPQDDSSRAVA